MDVTKDAIVSYVAKLFNVNKYSSKFKKKAIEEIRLLINKSLPKDEWDFVEKMIYNYKMKDINQKKIDTLNAVNNELKGGILDPEFKNINALLSMFLQSSKGKEFESNMNRNWEPKKLIVPEDLLTWEDIGKVDQTTLQGLSNAIDIEL